MTTPWGEPRGAGQELPPGPYLSFVLPAFAGRGTYFSGQAGTAEPGAALSYDLWGSLLRAFPEDSQGVPHPVWPRERHARWQTHPAAGRSGRASVLCVFFP